MDTMTFTKLAGGVCGALLIFLLGKWAAETVYHVGGHGSEQAYIIEVEGADDAAEDEVEISFVDVLASADVDKGAGVFRKCSACHKLESGANGTGPYLYGVVGRDIAADSTGFGYSDGLLAIDGDWTAENLNGFLEKPKDWAEGTSMGFAGLKKIEDRANVIAYLESLDN
ncbi:MAG: cytochrome c family protein [Paracoccaceae bacterium]